MKRGILLGPAALLGACAAPPAPVPAPVAAPTPAPPRIVTLPGAICDPDRSSETILKVQTAEARLRPLLEADPAFAGAWYEHAPCYRLVLAFTDGQPRPWVANAAPELRPYLAFSRAPRSAADAEAARIAIMSALSQAGLRYIFFAGGPLERFTIQLPSAADVPVAMQAIPERYRPDVAISVGSVDPIPE